MRRGAVSFSTEDVARTGRQRGLHGRQAPQAAASDRKSINTFATLKFYIVLCDWHPRWLPSMARCSRMLLRAPAAPRLVRTSHLRKSALVFFRAFWRLFCFFGPRIPARGATADARRGSASSNNGTAGAHTRAGSQAGVWWSRRSHIDMLRLQVGYTAEYSTDSVAI